MSLLEKLVGEDVVGELKKDKIKKDAENIFCSNCGKKIEDGAKFCQKCGAKVIGKQLKKESIESNKSAVDIEYFAISPGRLALFSILTLGIYEFYWFYKNWVAVKKFEGAKVSPFWRAWFAIFFCHNLFKQILKSAQKHGYQNSYSPGWLATAYIGLLLIGNGLLRVGSYDVGLNLFWLAIASATFIPLLSVQKAINFNNEKIKGSNALEEGFSGSEVILIVVGIILFILGLWGIFSS